MNLSKPNFQTIQNHPQYKHLIKYLYADPQTGQQKCGAMVRSLSLYTATQCHRIEVVKIAYLWRNSFQIQCSHTTTRCKLHNSKWHWWKSTGVCWSSPYMSQLATLQLSQCSSKNSALNKAWGYYAPKIEHYAFEQCSKNHLLWF